MSKKPSLKSELLFNLAFLAAAALLLGVGSVLVVSSVAPERAFPFILVIVALDVGIFIVFGRYIVTRHVLRPVERLVAAADGVAAGDLAARAPDAETADFALLAARLNRMTDSLLDAQGQLVRSEKLASVGRLAAGVAHEIGNPLGAIGTYLDVLRRRGADPEVMAGLGRELERIDRIVRSLLDYARPKSEALQPVAVEHVPIVGLEEVEVHASEDVGLRLRAVHLDHLAGAGDPFLAEDLGETATIVDRGIGVYEVHPVDDLRWFHPRIHRNRQSTGAAWGLRADAVLAFRACAGASRSCGTRKSPRAS